MRVSGTREKVMDMAMLGYATNVPWWVLKYVVWPRHGYEQARRGDIFGRSDE